MNRLTQYEDAIMSAAAADKRLAKTVWNVIVARGKQVVGHTEVNPSNRKSLRADRLSLDKIDVLRVGNALGIDPKTLVRIDETNKVRGGPAYHVPDGISLPYGTLERLMGTRSDNSAMKAAVLFMGEDCYNETAHALGLRPLIFATNEAGLPKIRSQSVAPITELRNFQGAMADPRCRDVLSHNPHILGLRRTPERVALDGVAPWSNGRVRKLLDVARLTVGDSTVYNPPQTRFPSKQAFWIPQEVDHDPLGGQFHEVAELGDLTVAVTSFGHLLGEPESPQHPAYNVLAEIGALTLELAYR